MSAAGLVPERRGCLHTTARAAQDGYKSATSNEEPQVPSKREAVAARMDTEILPVAMRSGVTPVPIPNTTVKPGTAESTTLETAWEARWLPDFYQLKFN